MPILKWLCWIDAADADVVMVCVMWLFVPVVASSSVSYWLIVVPGRFGCSRKSG